MAGFVFYRGPSRLDGSPIVGIATTGSENIKTGPLVQTWILRADVDPVNAARVGADISICGNCPMRGEVVEENNVGRACYVALFQAPIQVYRAFRAGTYPTLAAADASHFDGLGLRYGSYGDPVAIPRSAWQLLETVCTGRIRSGYTHQWQQKRFAHWRSRLMASTHTEQENALAHAMGWRTFRTLTDADDIVKGEIFCPASPEGGDSKQCVDCGACNGRWANDRRMSIAIVTHGPAAKINAAAEVIRGRTALQLV